LRILQVHNRYRSSAPSGENRVVEIEAAALRRQGHTVQRFERFSDEIAGWGVPKKALLPGKIVWSSETYKSLVRELREHRPDVVHVHNTFPLLSPSVLHACSHEQVPVVATLHNYRLMCPTGDLFRDGAICHDCAGRRPLPGVLHGCYQGSNLATVPLAVSSVVNRRAWRSRVSAYVCISHSQRDILLPFGLPADRTFVKHNLVPAKPPAKPSQRNRTVVFTGRISQAKGIPVLMEAWDLYSATSTSSSMRLVIAGGGPLEDEVTSWARDRKNADFLGILSPAECQVLLSTACATVIPSEWEETFGLVVVEAMAAGVPVIAAAHGSFPELMVNGEEGTLFPPGDATALADVFREVDLQPELYARYGRGARKAYETRFDPEDNINQLLSIYEFAIQHPVCGGRQPTVALSEYSLQATK
jgi:glycosyltransferase involved in cell wall biosynthesis